jgi:proteasome accessory factor B
MIQTLSSRTASVRDLSREFGISRRQVYRDLDRIEEGGHPLEQDHGFGERTWKLPLGYKGLPPIALSPYELMALYLAKSHLTYLEGTPFMEDLEGIIAKVKAALPAKTINHLERILQTFIPWQRPTRRYGAQKEVIAALRKALLLQHRVSLGYRKPDSRKPRAYLVDPYALILYQSGLYLVGYSHQARAQRIFAVERIVKVALMGELFEMPSSFSTQDQFRHLFGIMDGPPQEVQIQFRPAVAYLLKERKWHPTQKVKSLNRGAVLATFHTGGLEELTSWILSWGAQAKVIAPSGLRKAVTRELTAASKQYGLS